MPRSSIYATLGVCVFWLADLSHEATGNFPRCIHRIRNNSVMKISRHVGPGESLRLPRFERRNAALTTVGDAAVQSSVPVTGLTAVGDAVQDTAAVKPIKMEEDVVDMVFEAEMPMGYSRALHLKVTHHSRL